MTSARYTVIATYTARPLPRLGQKLAGSKFSPKTCHEGLKGSSRGAEHGSARGAIKGNPHVKDDDDASHDEDERVDEVAHHAPELVQKVLDARVDSHLPVRRGEDEAEGDASGWVEGRRRRCKPLPKWQRAAIFYPRGLPIGCPWFLKRQAIRLLRLDCKSQIMPQMPSQ